MARPRKQTPKSQPKPGYASPGQPNPGAPTPERLRHGDIHLVQERDAEGWPVQRCQVEDVVGRLLRNGLIDPDWAGAAERFRRDYRSAHFQPLGVRALQRQSSRTGQPLVIDRVEDARGRVGAALTRLGGLASPAGSIVWHVVGGEMSLNEWRERQRLGAGRVFRHEMAAGILIAAASALAAHYAGGPAARRGGADQGK